jgi:hypothetical protein
MMMVMTAFILFIVGVAFALMAGAAITLVMRGMSATCSQQLATCPGPSTARFLANRDDQPGAKRGTGRLSPQNRQ